MDGIMADIQHNAAEYEMPTPNPALQKFERLVGTWIIYGIDEAGCELNGKEIFSWMEGGFFLKQEIDQVYAGQKITGIQIIGYERKWGAEETADECTSHLFDNMGNSWEYVWELEGNALTVWGGYIGSPAAFKAQFSDDGNTLNGKWEWPGGGYKCTSRKIST
jgi:hypothetical protein